MLELFLSFLVLFIPFIILFIVFPSFQYVKYFIIITEFILCFILFSNNFYKKHYLWKENELSFIHSLPFKPIIDINITNSPFELEFKTLEDSTFSIVLTRDYSNKCNDYFYIKSKICPITNIIIENNKSNNYESYNEIKLDYNKYIYFTRNNSYKELYEDSYGLTKNLNFTGIYFNFQEYYNNYISNDNMIYNAFKGFKNYVKYCDFVCLALLIISLMYKFIESCDDHKFNYFKIINTFIQIAILIIYIFRYIKFKKIKNILVNNLYPNINKTNNYTPYKYFNIDSFVVVVPINLIIINVLSLIIPKKYHIIKENNSDSDKFNFCNDDDKKDSRIIYLLTPFLITSIIFIILDFINDLKIKKIYNNMIYNWSTSPIKSIELSPKKEYQLLKIYEYNYNYKKKETKIYERYDWKDKFFKIEKINNYNYINIYKNKNGKLCGKDSYGNNLYFPENIDCPINDIIITKNNTFINLDNYKKLYLGDNYILYYTNKNINGEIIVDLRISVISGPQLNLEKSNEICFSVYDDNYYRIYDQDKKEPKCKAFYNFSSEPFYKIIDKGEYYINYHKFEAYLYSINYLGINSSSITERNKIKGYKNNMVSLYRLGITKFVFFILTILIYFISFCLYKEISIIIFTIISILFLINIIIVSFCLNININYVHNFMNKINKDFDYFRAEYYYNIIIMVYDIIFYSFHLFLIIKFTKLFKCRFQNNQGNNVNITNQMQLYTTNQNILDGESETSKSNQKKCSICFVNPIKVIFAPCGHRAVCEKCYNNNKENFKSCPICKTNVENVIIKVIDQYFKN